MKKKEVKQNFNKLIQKYKLEKKLNIDELEKEIYNATIDDNQKILIKILSVFSKKNLEFHEQDELIKSFSDLWNYLPHKELGNISPHEKFKEEYGQSPDSFDNQEKKDVEDINFNVDGVDMTKEDYFTMLKTMEKKQKPFRKKMDKEILPAYLKFLEGNYKERTAEKHHSIASLFIDRAIFIGFLHMI